MQRAGGLNEALLADIVHEVLGQARGQAHGVRQLAHMLLIGAKHGFEQDIPHHHHVEACLGQRFRLGRGQDVWLHLHIHRTVSRIAHAAQQRSRLGGSLLG